jgi:hypothetical protein
MTGLCELGIDPSDHKEVGNFLVGKASQRNLGSWIFRRHVDYSSDVCASTLFMYPT